MTQLQPILRNSAAWAALLLIALLAGWYAYVHRSRVPEAAMSAQIALVIRFQSFATARHLTVKENDFPAGPFWRAALWEPLWQDADLFIQLCKNKPEQLRTVAGSPMLAGFTLLANDDMHPVYALDWGKEELADLLNNQGDSLHRNEYQFQGEAVYILEFPDKRKITLAQCGNLLLFSRLSYLVEDAIDQMQHGSSWWDNRKFQAVADPQAPIYLAIRPEKVLNHLASSLKAGRRPDHDLDTSPLMRWMGCSWDGQTATGAIIPGLISPFGKEVSIDPVTAIIPDDPSLLLWANLQEKPWWLYADQQTVYKQYVQPWVGTELAFTLAESYGLEQCRIFSVQDKAAAVRAFDQYGEKLGLLHKYDYQTFTIWHFFRPAILGIQTAADRHAGQNPAGTIIGDYVVFAPSTAILETWIDKFVVSQTLINQADWLLLRTSLPESMQAFTAINGVRLPGLSRELLNDESYKAREEIWNIAGRTGFIAFPITEGRNTPWRFSVHAKQRVQAKQESSLLWKTMLADEAITMPFIFKRSDNGRHILIQDRSYQIYCLDENGQTLWRRQMEEPVVSEIYCVDYFRNRRNFFLFNTPGRVILLDDQGNDVAGYPLHLQSPATNGLLAVDFDHDQQYSFFIACQNGNIYGFDQFGRPLAGWNPQHVNSKIRLPLRHLQTSKSDHLLVLDEAGNLSAFSRHGDRKFGPLAMEGRFEQPPQTDPAGNRIVCANTQGKLYLFNLQGSYFNLSGGSTKDKSPAWFTYQQVGGDERPDYAFLQGKKLQVSAYKGNQYRSLFSYSFDSKQDTLFGAPGFGLGVLDRSKKRISLIEPNGRLFPGFPLAGSTPFSMTEISKDAAILVVGYGSQVYAYKILHSSK